MAFGINPRRRAEQVGQRLTTPGAYDVDPRAGGGIRAVTQRQSDIAMFGQTGLDVADLTPEAFNALVGTQTGNQSGFGAGVGSQLSTEQQEQFNERFRDDRIRGQRGTSDVRVYDALTSADGGLGTIQAANLLDEAIDRLKDMQQGEGQPNNRRRRGAAPSRTSLFNVLGSSQV